MASTSSAVDDHTRSTRSGRIFCTWSNAFTVSDFSLGARIAQAEEEHQRIPLDFVDNPTLQEVDEFASMGGAGPPSPASTTSEDEAEPTHQPSTSSTPSQAPKRTLEYEDEYEAEPAPPTVNPTAPSTRKRRRKNQDTAVPASNSTAPKPSARRKGKSKSESKSGAARKPKWVRPPLPPVPERSPSPPHIPRRHKQRNQKRAEKKALAHQGSIPGVTSEQRSRFAQIASTVQTIFDTDDILIATSGYIGVERVEEEIKEQRQVHSLEELVGENSPWKFRVVKADMENPTPLLITDAGHRAFAVRISPPAGDPKFQDAAAQAADVMDQYRPLFFNENEPFPEHRRGDFPVKAFGVSYGGGQEVPKVLYQSDLDWELVNRIRQMRCFNRLAGQASAAFETWAPKLYALYIEYRQRLEELVPNTTRNFPSSIFSCCTLNFGPRTTTVEHLDHKNYIYGWCAITALGSFDHSAGGHLVLWDLKLVIEFPPGWTMLIPSAYLRHSNTTLRPGDTRFSFTQYTAGGLFRVIDDEGISRRRMAPAEKRHAEQHQRDRITQDLNCYSTLEELGVLTPL